MKKKSLFASTAMAAIVGACAVASAVIVGACAPAAGAASDDPTIEFGFSQNYAGVVVLEEPDGRPVTCAVYSEGGIDCNWSGR